jgi:predicted component of type VI protein secretion system
MDHPTRHAIDVELAARHERQRTDVERHLTAARRALQHASDTLTATAHDHDDERISQAGRLVLDAWQSVLDAECLMMGVAR